MDEIQFYDQENIDSFVWPHTKEGERAKNYLLPLIKGNVTDFINNVSTKLFLISYKEIFLPISINDAEYQNSYVVSNYYGLSFYDEFMRTHHPIFAKVQTPLLKIGEWFLKKIEINKCIFINNWLMTNNIPPHLDGKDLDKIVSFLKNRFPKHVLIFRNIDGFFKKNLLINLKENHFHVLKTREVFIYDPSKKENLSAKALSHHRKDRKIQSKYAFSLERDFSEQDISQMLTLYEKVYIKNYTPFSPQYNKEYLRNILHNKIFHFVGVKKEGNLEGIFGYFIRDNTMITPFFGFNTDAPYSGELYRLLSVMILEEAENHNVILNDSSGGETTKKYRGLVSYPEFMGIYPHHLPGRRKLFWNVLSFIYKKIVKI